MPQDVRIVSPKDFIRLDTYGAIDLATTRASLADIAQACVNSGIQNILVDMRGVQTKLKYRELEQLVRELGELGMDPEYKFAVIQRPGDFDRASFLAACGEEHGWQINTFLNFEDAFEWMNEAEEEKA